jgi:hypothetical protein
MHQVFQDKEIRWFYGIELGLPSLVALLVLIQGEWRVIGALFVTIVGFMYLGWPLSAEITRKGTIIFHGLLRHVEMDSKYLASVKASGPHDYRAHIVLRNRRQLPIGYRCRKYENAPELAQAILVLIEKAPDAKVTDDALKLLRQTAQGSRKPQLDLRT